MHPTDLAALRDAILRNDFASFIARVFHTVNPGTDYLPNWHIDLLAEYLEACRKGEITRLIVNLPPRALKSVCVTVAWPAFLMGRDPSARVIAASYAGSLAERHSLDTRLVMESPWYRQLFPATRLTAGENKKDHFTTTARGFRMSTSVGGTLTGQGGNILIVDDPHKPEEITSVTRRAGVYHWYEHTFASRLDDKHKGVAVLVMQRLHPHDLSGYLTTRANHRWEHLVIPAVAPEPKVYARGGITKTVEAGEPLHPAREDAGLIARAKEELGTQAFAAQYLQQPIPPEGNLIKTGWLPRFDLAYAMNAIDRDFAGGKRPLIVQSWDTGIKTATHNDPSACVTMLVGEHTVDILDVYTDRMNFPTLRHAVLRLAERCRAEIILIEDAASGQSLIQTLRAELPPGGPSLYGIRPDGSKLKRLHDVIYMIESGQVRLPHTAGWLADFETELFGFPAANHDDQVDALTQGLNWVKKRQTRDPVARLL